MTLAVIGAGFGRTGTFSLKRALEQLGFGPCCHGSEERHFKRGTEFWLRVFNRESIDWNEFFHGYRSTVDSPSCRFYLELAEKYPSAKVILTWRESNAWFDSYQKTILPMITSSNGGQYFSFLFGSEFHDRDSVIAEYERHNAEVQTRIPAERLLVYEVKRGWQPLCQFLGVPIPDTPFPHVNLKSEFPFLVDSMLAHLDSEVSVDTA
jgi:hypothetical protein